MLQIYGFLYILCLKLNLLILYFRSKVYFVVENYGLIMNTETDCKISVLITFFNQKEYINECLTSVLSQKTGFSFEILCGDDNSNDGTYEELLRWKQEYPDVIRVYRTDSKSSDINEPIIRASNNRYSLLCHAQGRYLCFLDGDDYYSDDMKLQKQYDILEKHPEVSGCFHPILLKWDTDHPDDTWGLYSDERVIMSYKLYWGCLWSAAETFMFRNSGSELIKSVNKDFFDDNLITANFIKNGKLIYIPEPMVVYRQSDISSWNSRNEFEKAYINLLVYQELKRIFPKLKSQVFTKCYDAIRFVYDNRRTDWKSIGKSHFVLEESIYLDTINYYRNSFFRRIIYELKWLFPIYLGKVLKVLRNRLKTLKWKKI